MTKMIFFLKVGDQINHCPIYVYTKLIAIHNYFPILKLEKKNMFKSLNLYNSECCDNNNKNQ